MILTLQVQTQKEDKALVRMVRDLRLEDAVYLVYRSMKRSGGRCIDCSRVY